MNGKMIDKSWAEVKAVIDKVHKHVCGQANFNDMRMLLDRNNLWNDAVEKYVGNLISSCTACRSTAPPQLSRKVLISSLSKQISDIVCVDHFYVHVVRLMHCVDAATRFSAAFVVSSASMNDAVFAFESCWISQFWEPTAIHGDKAFAYGSFMEFMNSRDIMIRLVPPRCHTKNSVESKHGVIRMYISGYKLPPLTCRRIYLHQEQ